jgi:hypothetical protein
MIGQGSWELGTKALSSTHPEPPVSEHHTRRRRMEVVSVARDEGRDESDVDVLASFHSMPTLTSFMELKTS